MGMEKLNTIMTGPALKIGGQIDALAAHTHIKDGSVELKYVSGKNIGNDNIEATFSISSDNFEKLELVHLGLD